METKRTMIVAAFPACGKTYLTKNQESLRFQTIYGERNLSFTDLDTGYTDKEVGWEKKYVDSMLKLIGSVDFIFTGQREAVLKELAARGIKYVTVTPYNSYGMPWKEQQIIKNQWFGRFVLRDNSHIDNIEEWFRKFKDNFNTWTSPEFLNQFSPAATYALQQNEFIEDIVPLLFEHKETKDEYVQEAQS